MNNLSPHCSASDSSPEIETVTNPSGARRILATKRLSGNRWTAILAAEGCRVDILADNDGLPLSADQIRATFERAASEQAPYIGTIGQLNEPWRADLLEFCAARGLRYYSNYAVGFDNVDIAAASRLGILIGTTPGVLTEATAEIAVALTFAAARRIPEMDAYTRAGKFRGWHPNLGVGQLIEGATAGILGAGRIGCCYAEKMAGAGCSILYFSRTPKPALEGYVRALGEARRVAGRRPVTCRRAASLDELLSQSDILSIHCPLTPETRGMIGAAQLARMKPGAILINTARGAVVDEPALVRALREGPLAATGLDVYEKEPLLAPGLSELPNAVLLPHIGSATHYSREGMATIAAANLRGMMRGFPPCPSLSPLLEQFLSGENLPDFCPSVLNYDKIPR